jgi:CRP/FNR family cyclic AMP-dependent transcriptional regulator
LATDLTSAIHRLIQSTEFAQLRERLAGFRPPEIAAVLLDLNAEDQVLAFRLLVDKDEMVRLLHEQHALSDRFIAYMLARKIQVEADLVDQLFNSSEKRLTRTLLLLARYGKHDQPVRPAPQICQETLAEMVGTTRLHVNFFMKKFERLGFVDYTDGLKVNNSLLTVVLHD